MTDFPFGDGHAQCPDCYGRGVVEYTPPGGVIPGTAPCSCVHFRSIQRNMDRGWKGLAKSKNRRRNPTPLDQYLDTNLRVRCSDPDLRKHLWRLVADQHSRWSFNVYSDADLMDSWLARVDDSDIYDPDVERIRRTAVSGRFLTLVDLVEPPGVLVLRTGVKAARNSAMPEVFLEALQHRSMIDKPTWIVDTAGYPLEPGHIAFDHRVGDFISDWEFLELEDDDTERGPVKKTSVKKKTGSKPRKKKARPMTVAGMMKRTTF